MNPRQAKRLVVVSILGSTAMVIFDHARDGDWPEMRVFTALGIVAIVLGVGADFAPQLAGPFALLFAVATVLTRGELVIRAFDRLTRRQVKTQSNGHKQIVDRPKVRLHP